MEEQLRIKNWFDQNYKRQGFQYLRPLAAYAIYVKLLDLQAGEKLLDVACGPGLMLRQAINAGAEAFGIDISDTAVEMAQKYVPEADVRPGNAEDLPFPDNALDAVTCLGSLERMINLEKVLQEIHRVGHEQTHYCFLVRNSNTLTWKLFMERLGLRNEDGHQGAKSLSEWTDLFKNNGFEIRQILPDQWPFVRWGRILSLGLIKPDPTVIRWGIGPLSYAYEFIFILQKR